MTHAPYDPFAWFYDRHWGHAYHRAVEPVLDRLVLSVLDPGARVLDLGCGAGHTLARLGARGFEAIGVDLSAEMLRHARARAPEAMLVHGDVRVLDLPLEVSAAISLFESLSHVLELEALGETFRRVRRTLRPGGRLVFDLNREEAYLQHWSGSHAIVEAQAACFTRASYDPATRLARCALTTFRAEPGAPASWARADTVLTQRAHPVDAVVAHLLEAGFARVDRLDAARELGMGGDLGTGRTFFVAHTSLEPR